MGKEDKPKQSSKCCVLMVNLFLAGLLFFVGILYLGMENNHTPTDHPLSIIFETEAHQQLVKQISESDEKRIIVTGSRYEGVLDFLKHYGDQRSRNGHNVKFKVLSDDLYQNFIQMCQDIKDSTLQAIGLKDTEETIQWIYLIKRPEYYWNQVNQKIQKQPNSRIIIALPTKSPQFQSFHQFSYTPVSTQHITKIIGEVTSFSGKQLEILVRFYTNIQILMQDFKNTPITIKNILGSHYLDISSLSDEDKAILNQTCTNGKFKSKSLITGDVKDKYKNLGLYAYRRKAFWFDHKDRLNYELANLVICVPEKVPEWMYRMSYDKQFAQQQRNNIIEEIKKMQQQDKQKKGQKRETLQQQRSEKQQEL